MENCIKLRINAGDKNAGVAQDKAIADAYRNKFIIPLDFEMLDSATPYYQAGLGNRLCYELTFSDYNRVTRSTASSSKVPDAKYKITDISLEYEIITQPNLMRSIRSEYQHMALLYDRILRHTQISVNKSDTMWNCHLIPLANHLKASWFYLKKKSHTHETQASSTIPAYKRSLLPVHIPNFGGVAGLEDFACATLPTTPLDFQSKI